MSYQKPQSMVRIAVDAMGGDSGPEVIIPALVSVLKSCPNVFFLIFGDEHKIRPVLMRYKTLSESMRLYHADKIVKNDDKPSDALRASKGSSMRMAIEAVKNGEADAVVSAGNTGALMAMAKIVLKTVPGVHRPAIASVIPGIHGDTVMLDLGANILVDSENLVQFAILGTIFARANKKIERPRVALLNIGSEETKGPDHVRSAAEILSRIDFSGEYHGFIEGNDITTGLVDVVVCDGYAGNIALKTLEGVGEFMRHALKESLRSNFCAMIGCLFSYFALKAFSKRMDPRRYNGGVFLGLNGVCVKSHGSADSLGFANAVILAINLVNQGYITEVVQDIESLLDQETFPSQDV